MTCSSVKPLVRLRDNDLCNLNKVTLLDSAQAGTGFLGMPWGTVQCCMHGVPAGNIHHRRTINKSISSTSEGLNPVFDYV